jgi:hypothetical protein
VNNIAENLLGVIRHFADDSSLSVSSHDISYIESTLNSDLGNIKKWSKHWLINFNPNKTEVFVLES